MNRNHNNSLQSVSCKDTNLRAFLTVVSHVSPIEKKVAQNLSYRFKIHLEDLTFLIRLYGGIIQRGGNNG